MILLTETASLLSSFIGIDVCGGNDPGDNVTTGVFDNVPEGMTYTVTVTGTGASLSGSGNVTSDGDDNTAKWNINIPDLDSGNSFTITYDFGNCSFVWNITDSCAS